MWLHCRCRTKKDIPNSTSCNKTNEFDPVTSNNAELNSVSFATSLNNHPEELNQRNEKEIIIEKIISNLKEDIKNNEEFQKTNERLKNLLN